MQVLRGGARVIEEKESQEVSGRSSLWLYLPGGRAAVSCRQPESSSPSAVQTLLHLDGAGAGERGDHSVRSFVSSASATAVSAVADAALARGGGSTVTLWQAPAAAAAAAAAAVAGTVLVTHWQAPPAGTRADGTASDLSTETGCWHVAARRAARGAGAGAGRIA